MAVTGTQVTDRINSFFSDTANLKWSAAQKLEAVNAAIDDGWPGIKDIAYDTSQTLAAGTYEYTPTNQPEVEWGYSLAYVTLSNSPKVSLMGARQRQNGTSWVVVLRPDTVSAFAGETLHLAYNKRVARISVIGDSVEMPLDYLWKAGALWLCWEKLKDSAHFDVRPYEMYINQFTGLVEKAKLSARRGDLPHKIPIVAELGSGDINPGRYGQNVIPS